MTGGRAEVGRVRAGARAGRVRAGARAEGIRRPAPVVLLVLVSLLLAACSGVSGGSPVPGGPATGVPSMTTVPIPPGDVGGAGSPPPLGQRVTQVDPPVPAAPLAVPDASGRPFDLASLRGSPVLVYFGYTHCPDICPTTFGVLREVVKERPDAKVVFVTVDPARDTPKAVADYLAFFHQGWIGLSGTDAETRAAADGYGVMYAKVDTGSASGYAMEHTSEVYLVGADGMLRYRFPFGAQESEIVAGIDAIGG